MKVYGVNKVGLDFALALGNANFDGNVKYAYEPAQISRVCFRLRLQHKQPGPGSSMTKKRRGPAVCWHAHRDFMRAIYTINPDARITTSFGTYNNERDFEFRHAQTRYGKCKCEIP